MLYKINHDVPANTAIAAPDWQKLQVCKGTIKEWVIVAPLECANLMQFWVEYHGLQILPFSHGERIYGISWPVVIHENLELDVDPYVLDVKAINTDTVKQHEYNLYVNVLREEPFKPPTSGFNFKEVWSKLFGGG